MTRSNRSQRPGQFPGFEPLDANYLYCPNQFFDVLLPHASRGTLRLVSYLLRRTLGWLDRNGEPVEQEITVSWNDLIAHAGISRGALRSAVEDAIASRFIDCLMPGRPDQGARPAVSSQFRLRWSGGAPYAKTPETFDGFFAGEGHRTAIPNAFFDHIVAAEPLSIVKVVGTVLRHTVGYQNQFGGRRSTAPLSQAFIAEYARLSLGKSLHSALQGAINAGYIVSVEPGQFSPNPDEQSAACYAVRWQQQATQRPTGSKTPVATPDQFKRPSSTGSKLPAGDRFKNPSSRKTPANDTDKQQPAAAVDSQAVELLRVVGFDAAMAKRLAAGRGVEQIQSQINWLEHRRPERSRLGMLRRAIEEDWAAPEPVGQAQKQAEQRQQQRSEQHSELADAAEASKQRLKRRRALLQQWRALTLAEQRNCHQKAIQDAVSALQRARLQRHRDLTQPPTEALLAMNRLHPAKTAL